MDALKAEIALKRKTFQDVPPTDRPAKYMRRGDIERLKEEQERKEREDKEAKERERKEAEKAAKPQVSLRSSMLVLQQLRLISEWRTALDHSFSSSR